jgi:hypothetical protein
MTQLDTTDETQVLLAPPLELAFQWDGARWRHTLRIGGAVVAASVECDPDRDDPARVISPSYQQIGCDERNGTRRAMLVGQWGPHHGSAAFVVAETDWGVVIDVDVAVRSRSELAAMACTYQVDRTSSDLIDADQTAIAWAFEDPPRGVLWFEAEGLAERVGLAEAGRRATRVQVERPIEAGEATQRLRYRWRWIGEPA